MNEKKVTVSK